jgi:serpin B
MKRFYVLILLTACLCACEKIGAREELIEEMAPAEPIVLTKADEGVRDASNASGLDIFSRLYAVRDGQDVSFSPLSLSLAFAMAAEGAEGETYQQIADAFGWGDATKEQLGAFYKKMIDGLVKADQNVKFTSSNSLWTAKSFAVKDSYKKLLSDYFAAESYQVDFASTATVKAINDWCSVKTDGKIPEMLRELDPETRMMLINALLYKAPWATEWTVEKNRSFRGDGAVSKKDFLFANKSFGYADLGDCEAVSLAYGNGAYEMVVFLPKEGRTVEGILPKVKEKAGNLVLPTRTVEVHLPMFSTEYSTEEALPVILKAKGVRQAFSDKADFSGISSAEAVMISEVLQKVRIDVTEKGTEFAAVTTIGFYTSSLPVSPPQKIVFDADRPFVYMIRETSTSAILLIGSLSR